MTPERPPESGPGLAVDDPMISPLAWLAVGAVLGAWSWALAALTPPQLAAAACAAAAASFALPVRPSLVLIGIVLGQAAIAAQPEPAALRDWTSGEVLGVSGRSVLLKTPQGHLWTQLWPKPPPVGSLVAGRLRASAPRQALPGSWPSHAQAILSRAHQARMHPWVSLTPSEAMPTALAHVRHRGLIWALATGDRSAIDDETTNLLRRTGAAHLLAISGLHVGMVAALAWAIAWALTRGLTSGPWPPIARVLPSLMSAIAACLYAQAVGWPVSTQRAAMMVAGACACAIIGRRVDPWQILGIAALAVLAVEPSQVASLGFMMSFGAAGALIGWMPRWSTWTAHYLPRPLRWAANSLGVTLVATLGTLPCSAWVFQSVPIGGILANLLAVPLFSLVTVPAALLASYGPEVFASMFAAIAERSIDAALAWLEVCDLGELNPAIGPVLAIALAVAVLTQRPRTLALIVACSVFSFSLPTRDLVVTFPAVGQGSAALVSWPDGRTWLIDGGPDGRGLTQWLRRTGIDTLDRVVVSHPDLDHFGGIEPVISSLDIGELWLSRPPVAGEDRYRHLWLLAHQKAITIRSSVAQEGRTDNDAGVVVSLRHGQHRFLFLGDVSREVEREIARQLPRTSVVQMSHHGSGRSSDPAIVDATKAAFAVVQSGPGNRYGHPSPEAIRRWSGTKVLRTDTLGSIRIRSNGTSLVAQRWDPVWGWRSIPRSPAEQR